MATSHTEFLKSSRRLHFDITFVLVRLVSLAAFQSLQTMMASEFTAFESWILSPRPYFH
jgi:hypothetical protein